MTDSTSLREDVHRLSLQLKHLDDQVSDLKTAAAQDAGSRRVLGAVVTMMAVVVLAWVGWVSNVAIQAQAATNVIAAQRQETNQAILQRLDRIERRLERIHGGK